MIDWYPYIVYSCSLLTAAGSILSDPFTQKSLRLSFINVNWQPQFCQTLAVHTCMSQKELALTLPDWPAYCGLAWCNGQNIVLHSGINGYKFILCHETQWVALSTSLCLSRFHNAFASAIAIYVLCHQMTEPKCNH